jgi:holo-[acyl-carrier protein] synthase
VPGCGRDHRCGHRRRRRGALHATLERTPRLRQRLFTDDEQQLPPNSLAARFAAKEAFAKALGAPVGLHWLDAEVHRGADGRPHLTMQGTVAARAAQLGVRRTHVSLSHDAGIASAVVIVEGVPTGDGGS